VGGRGVYYPVALQNKTKTPRALAVNCTWSQFMFDGVGHQRGEQGKRIVSDSYAMGPVERTPLAQACPIVTQMHLLENNYTKHRRVPYNGLFAHSTF